MLNVLDELGDRQTGLALDSERADAAAGETVDPNNLLGIELNPRAAAIAEVVLWIGYLQWHFRTRGNVHPPQPVIRDFRNIENRDAVLAYDSVEFVTDEHGVPVTRWDGETMKTSPVTGEQVPDESARNPVEQYVNPRKAEWPEADFVVGNPPFIGASSMRSALGDGYVDALRSTWSEVPESADFVMHWWHHAAQLTSRGAVERFGFITTNSIKQTFNRRVVERHLSETRQPLSLAFAIPDHPWVDTADGAAVRIAMTVGVPGGKTGRMLTSVREGESGDGEVSVEFAKQTGVIHQDLRVGADVASAVPLRAMQELSSPGLKLHGSGFVVTQEKAQTLGLGRIPGLEKHIRPYRNGRDLSAKPRGVYVIDLYGMTSEEVRKQFPEIYQHIYEHVKPERDHNNRAVYRDLWWIHGEPRGSFRPALDGQSRYIATVETTKHRVFQFLDSKIAADNMLIAVAIDDGVALGVLGSRMHVTWALASGGTLEDRPRYNKSRCFETFPFPDFQAADKFGGPIGVALVDAEGTGGRLETYGEYPSDRVRELAEQLDAHRKRQQDAHPGLTLTNIYNVLEKLRSGEELTARERTIHEQGLVFVLRQLHDELDEAVLDAYGWGDLIDTLRIAHGNVPPPEDTTREDAKRTFDETILERLVALNAERAAEEARGQVRWLRPEFQNPEAEREPEQADLATDSEGDDAEPAALAAPAARPKPWPKDTVDQVRTVADTLVASPVPLSIDEIASRFTARGRWKERLPKLLEMLVVLGRAQEQDGVFTAI